MSGSASKAPPGAAPFAWWEAPCVGGAMAAALALGLAHLGAPSLWHDELVHVFVARSIAESGAAALPSGVPYYSGALFNYLLAAVIRLFGDGEAAVRAPSAVFGALNAGLTYLLARRWLGRPAALIAAWSLAVSPWAVAWSRQARFYALQQTLYLAMLCAADRFLHAGARPARLAAGLAAVGLYVLGMLASFHSVFFLAAPAAYALWRAARRRDRAAAMLLAALPLLAAIGVGIQHTLSNPTDFDAMVNNAGLLAGVWSLSWRHALYYPLWLEENLGSGFFLLALAGTALALATRRGRGLFACLAFWAPVIALSLLVGYRWQRFMFFAYPAYVILHAYGAVWLLRGMARARRSPLHALIALVLFAFGIRAAVSQWRLAADSLHAARGAGVTLAAHHPEWREAGAWLRAHRTTEPLLTTTYLAARYYAGSVDDWFPSAYIAWERQDSGLPGLRTLAELQAYVARHPAGYFAADAERFERWRFHGAVRGELDAAVEWVRTHMRRIPEASTADVTVYAWGAAANGAS